MFLGKFRPKNWSSPDRLKFGVCVHCYILISNLMIIFSKFLSFIFFGQIRPQNLKFLKLNGIWYRGTLLYVYYNFNVHFSKIFVTYVFLGKFGTIIWIFPNWLKVRRVVHCYMLIRIFYIYKSFVVHTILSKFGPKVWCCLNWLESNICEHYWYYMLIIIESSSFPNFLFKISWTNFVPSCFLQIDGITSYLSKCGEQQILGWNLPKNLWTANTPKNYTQNRIQQRALVSNIGKFGEH